MVGLQDTWNDVLKGHVDVWRVAGFEYPKCAICFEDRPTAEDDLDGSDLWLDPRRTRVVPNGLSSRAWFDSLRFLS